MSNYYYLIAGLPELTLEDTKLSYTVSDFKTEIYPDLSAKDQKLIDLFYLKFDNANLLKLLKNKEAAIDERGNFSSEELLGYIKAVKDGDKITDKCFPAYLPEFIAGYLESVSDDEPVLWEDTLSAAYYKYAMECGNKFVSSWFSFNLTVNNVLTALTVRKYKLDIAPNIVGETEVTEALRTSGARDFGLSGDIDYFEQLIKIGEIDELLEREKKLDSLRWDWIEEAIFFHYFSLERIFAFLLRLEMIERWLSLDKEKGKELFKSIIASLKDDVQIPSEFIK